MKRLFFFLISIISWCGISAQPYSPATLENPHTADIRNYTANPDHILSAAAVSEINRIALQTDKLSEVETVVIAIEAMANNEDAADFAQAVFNRWGIGRKDKNTGVMILLVRQSHDIRIHTGGGLEGILTDARCSQILNDKMIPLLSEGQWDKGILAGVNAISAIVTTDEARQELLLSYTPKPTKGTEGITLYFCLAFIALILLSLIAYRTLNRNHTALNNVRYTQAKQPMGWLTICAVVFPLPCAFFLLWYKRAVNRLRLTPVTCPECRQTMRRLSETEEDEYLNSKEQAEEKAKTMDYDVWYCPSCLNHLVLPYRLQQSKYSRCPHCGALTYALMSDVVLSSATQLREGKGEKTYQCAHCRHKDVQFYTLPKLPIVVTSGGSSRGGGGGFSGGSFGGGISFGGGAGGKF
ncbi:MAG: TPM domain-containing protein [Bacteroidales bacterium]|nr:TPM domain-containing protein [Bacteroidales bacterium]